jgi:hypothetical protein
LAGEYSGLAQVVHVTAAAFPQAVSLKASVFQALPFPSLDGRTFQIFIADNFIPPSSLVIYECIPPTQVTSSAYEPNIEPPAVSVTAIAMTLFPTELRYAIGTDIQFGSVLASQFT